MFKKEQQTETIEVRNDERFDQQKLVNFLVGQLPGADNDLKIKQFGGGKANLTYLLNYGSHEYVLRRPPLGPVAKGAHDMGREYKVLSKLYQRFPFAPRAFLYSDNLDIIGAPFFVMERRQGIVVRQTFPAQYREVSDAGLKMSYALVDGLARFHAVDYDAIGLSDLGRPAGFISRQIEGWYKRWHKAKIDDLGDMEWTYHWLKERLPESSIASLVHNDYKLDNCMLATDDPSQLVAIFDWDMCTLGDPLADLGALLTYWTEPTDPPYVQAMATMPRGDYGFASRRQLIERYAETSGQSVEDIDFYYTLGLYRLVVIIQQIYIRYVRGQTQDQRFKGLNEVVPLIAKAARNVASGQLEI